MTCRVIQGVQMQCARTLIAAAAASHVSAAEQHVKLWCHEVMRVFYDRLVDTQEQAWLLGELKRIVSARFNMSFDTLFARLAADAAADGKAAGQQQQAAVELTTTHLRRCFFGDYMSEVDDSGSKPYTEVLRPEVRVQF